MEDILDYNPEFIYYKNGEKNIWVGGSKNACYTTLHLSHPCSVHLLY